MNAHKLTHFEQKSLSEAGSEAGAYLESIGKFDLSQLSEDQWMEFLTTILESYGKKMREHILSYEAPF